MCSKVTKARTFLGAEGVEGGENISARIWDDVPQYVKALIVTFNGVNGVTSCQYLMEQIVVFVIYE